MIPRFLFIIGIVLLLFPILQLPSWWKDWVAFVIGLYLIIWALYEGVWKKK